MQNIISRGKGHNLNKYIFTSAENSRQGLKQNLVHTQSRVEVRNLIYPIILYVFEI